MRNTIEIVGLLVMVGIAFLLFANTGFFSKRQAFSDSVNLAEDKVENTIKSSGARTDENLIKELDGECGFNSVIVGNRLVALS